MSDGIHLRERLAAADGFNDRLSKLRADRALPVFADWVRDEAAKLWRNRELSDEEAVIVGYLQAMADDIYPKEAHDGQ